MGRGCKVLIFSPVSPIPSEMPSSALYAPTAKQYYSFYYKLFTETI